MSWILRTLKSERRIGHASSSTCFAPFWHNGVCPPCASAMERVFVVCSALLLQMEPTSRRGCSLEGEDPGLAGSRCSRELGNPRERRTCFKGRRSRHQDGHLSLHQPTSLVSFPLTLRLTSGRDHRGGPVKSALSPPPLYLSSRTGIAASVQSPRHLSPWTWRVP